jgi:peroxiredoxin Q/BCP
MMIWLLGALALFAVLLFWRTAASNKAGLPRVGDPLPAFELPDQSGATRTDREFRGRWLVLYFYPRDDTPGCTEQAAKFRDAMRDFEAAGAAVCGISVDAGESHAAFARKYNLPYALLSDRDGRTSARFGSLLNLVLVKFARRNTFLADPQGRVAKIYLGVNPARNAGDVLRDLKELAR